MVQDRGVLRIIDSIRTLEGGGFPVRRPFPTAELLMADPFLLLDHLGPVDWGPGEAIGAPDHPHRGFETVTYLLSGEMVHKDSSGHSGRLGPGDVQWMTAGSGIVHSELPSPAFLANGGVMHGFQIWVNLPAKDKMHTPRYQEVPGARLPQAEADDGKVRVKIIAGEALGKSAVIDTVIPITYLHFTLAPGGRIEQDLAHSLNAFVYLINGTACVGRDQTRLREGQLAQLGDGDRISVHAPDSNSGPTDLLILAGQPLNEPVARHGPFVMNTEDEIRQAIRDYREGRMGHIDS